MTRFLALLLALLAGPALARTVATATSPGGVLTVEVALDNDGRPSYAVTRAGKPVIEASRLGIMLVGDLKLERRLAAVATAPTTHDATWEQPWGERRFVRDRHTELRVRFTEEIGAKRALAVVFRVFDDGVGFRYEFPDQAALSDVRIADELTEFAVAEPGTAWWIPGGEWNRYEYLYNRTPIDAVAQAHTPLTVRTQSGLHVAIHEAALVDYSAMWLRRVEGRRLKAVLSPGVGDAKVERTAPFATPWRVILVAEDAPRLYAASDIILNLNEPNKLGDVSWFTPHKYVGVWWEMHLETATWGSGAKHGATTANTRRYIDFAAKHGMRGVLVEGWNTGWDGDWYNNGGVFSFTEAYPDFDLPGLAAYARRKGVRLIGHHETSGNAAHYEGQLGAALDLYAKHGVDAVKTGYVADAGQARVRLADGSVRTAWHDGQAMSRHHLKVVTEAASRRIAVNPHEPIKDTGLRRTYPNWVSREGARGMEYNAWGSPPNPPEHEANLVFTRMLSGPFDFTPGVISLEGRGQPLQSTVAKQLANYVVLYSPIQMAADLPENYEKNLQAFQFIKDVPVDWAETRVLAGEVGDYAVIARKDRNSGVWALGAVTDEVARTVPARLDFLAAGRRYRAEIYADGEGADWRTNPRAIAITRRNVTAADTLELKLAAGGGQAIRFVPLR